MEQNMTLGHNNPPQNIGGISGQHLRQFVERIERLEEEKRSLAEDIKEVYQEAKGNGFDVKTIRKIVTLRKIEPTEIEEQETLLDLYKAALGMIPEADEE